MERNQQIDVARGKAILLVVLGHSFYSMNDPLNKLILSFHMPLFFFVSGLLAKQRKNGKGTTYEFLLKKAKSFLVPQVTLGVLSYMYYLLNSLLIDHENVLEISFLYQIWRYWFLQVLFEVVVMLYFLSKYIELESRKNQVLIVFSALVLGVIISYLFKFPDKMPLYLNVLTVAVAFYMTGYSLKDRLLLNINKKRLSSCFCMRPIVLTAGLLFSAFLNKSVTMYNNSYGNFCLFLLSSFCGIDLV